MEHPNEIAGWIGVDETPERRPGIPMEIDPPHPMGAAHWGEPERQPDPGPRTVLRQRERTTLTPVFGTTVPPRGVSGGLRRLGYRIPEHRTTHWLVLLLADRVDVFEDRVRRGSPFLVPLALAIGGGALALGRASRRRRRWRSRLGL
jgi:hypothetical protein